MMIEYDKTEPFRMIGLQPFQRPGLQCAFAVRMEHGEDFEKFSSKVLFKQNVKWNNRLHKAFYPYGKNILFPNEEIRDVVSLIKEANSISKMAVKKYSDENGILFKDIEVILDRNKVNIVEQLPYALSRQQRRKLEREYEGRPYGDVKLH